jgi:hypothetical protein
MAERKDLYPINVRLHEASTRGNLLESQILETLFNISGVVMLGEFLTHTGPRIFSLIVQADSLEIAQRAYVEVGSTPGVASAKFGYPLKQRAEA